MKAKSDKSQRELLSQAVEPEDLIQKFGLIPEFIGRASGSDAEQLSEEALIQILKEPKTP